VRIFVLYRLKDGASFDEYQQWSRAADQPTLRGSGHVSEFRVFATTPTEASRETYTVVETIDVDSPEAWTEITESAEVKALGPAFDRFVDPDSLCILHGEEIRSNGD
jgi:hypothetical protein